MSETPVVVGTTGTTGRTGGLHRGGQRRPARPAPTASTTRSIEPLVDENRRKHAVPSEANGTSVRFERNWPAQVLIVDAVGIAGVALILNVPLAAAIGVLVFLGAFIPIVGAFLSGMVAVLVALVAQGPVTALLMLAGVIAVQQLESHVLQPFIMGHLVAVHPLAIILAIAAGIVTAGIVGALLAVPFAACLNSVVRHLVSSAEPPGPEPADGTAIGEPTT